MKQRRSFFFVLAMLAVVGATWSFMILTAARNQTLDQRVHDVASQLKCPVCQGESVADSPSTISQQMRAVIREQLQSGRSEQQVIQYFVDRYGEQIVWSPPWQGFTLLVWLVPIALLLAGALLLFTVLRDWRNLSPSRVPIYRARGVTPPANSAADEAELANIDEAELQQYRAQIEEELAASDHIFARQRMEAN
jgi:cytochrome c-type biogenesis protein CcmH